MKKFSFKNCLKTLVLSSCLLMLQGHSEEADDECSKEILLSYFPKQFVEVALKNYNVSQDQWETILQELDAKEKDVIPEVEARAAKMDPNPLKDPQQRSAATKLFRDTLTEMFASVMKKHGVTDEKQVQTMLDDIQKQKAKRFLDCMEKQRGSQEQKAS